MDSSFFYDSSQKRMAELQKAAQKNKYGYMFSITRGEYIRQVTEASQEIPVVVFLYKDRYPFYIHYYYCFFFCFGRETLYFSPIWCIFNSSWGYLSRIQIFKTPISLTI